MQVFLIACGFSCTVCDAKRNNTTFLGKEDFQADDWQYQKTCMKKKKL